MILPPRATIARLALALCTVAAACTTDHDTPGATYQANVETVRSAELGAVDAWNRGDLDAHVVIYADTGTGGPPIGPGGRARARRALAPFFVDPRPALRIDSLTISPLGSEYVLGSGKWVLSGPTLHRNGWFTHIWARLPGGWRIVYEHST